MLLKTAKQKKSRTRYEEPVQEVKKSSKEVEELDLPFSNRYSVPYEENTMKGLFFIVRGSYCKKGKAYVVENEDPIYLGGYDPEDMSNTEWYMVLDKVTFNSVYSGSNYDRALKSIGRTIERYLDTPKKYFKMVSELTSEDFYEVHYQKKRPLNREGINSKAVGRQPRVSPRMWLHYMCIYNVYGNYYREDIEVAEEEACEKVKDLKNPVRGNMKKMKRLKKLAPKRIRCVNKKSL